MTQPKANTKKMIKANKTPTTHSHKLHTNKYTHIYVLRNTKISKHHFFQNIPILTQKTKTKQYHKPKVTNYISHTHTSTHA